MIPAWFTADVMASLARGLAFTVGLTVITSALALVLGIAIGTLRLSVNRGRRFLAAAYTEVFRNVPALIQILFWAFAVPRLFPDETRQSLFFKNTLMDGLGWLTGLPIPYYGLAAVLGLTLNTSAYLAEIFRSGVGSIPTEQMESVRTLGAGRRDLFRTVLFPSALRISFPAISTRLIHNLKNTALASFVAVPELFHQLTSSIQLTFRATEFLLLGVVMYLVLTYVMSLMLDHVDGRLQGQRRNVGV